MKRRLAQLVEQLAVVQQALSDYYSTVLLIAPGAGSLTKGIYDYRVKLVEGTRFPFAECNVETLVTTDTQDLYLLPKNQYTPIRVLPFFRLMASPSTSENACYFYNRLDRSGV